MPANDPSTSTAKHARSTFDWVILPAVVMSLGWGLRGYIGGGPLGAMIPGTLIALVLCQNLGIPARAAAAVTAFGAIGIGFGGEMTYGQTLGLLRDGNTFWWGLLGTTLKGGVWGLLGGAVLGLGFVVNRLTSKSLLLALLCLLVGVVVGLHFINQPKLVYFSNPVDRPRDESWGGFLLGAIALLAYLRKFESDLASIAWTFSAYGAIGGALGFGGGSLLLAMQTQLPDDWRWLPCWKFMEFAFGAAFGAALGMAARSAQGPLKRVVDLRSSQDAADLNCRASFVWPIGVLIGGLIVGGVFLGWLGYLQLFEANWHSEALDDPRRAIARVLLGFTGLGGVLLLLSRRWDLVAWQVAISITIVAAAIDWQRDLLPRGEIDLAPHYRALFVVILAAISIIYVTFWRAGRNPRLAHLAVFTTCVLMGIGYLMGLALADLWWPAPERVAAAGGRLAYLWQSHRSELVVHAIFTALLVISLVGFLRAGRLRGTTETTPAA